MIELTLLPRPPNQPPWAADKCDVVTVGSPRSSVGVTTTKDPEVVTATQPRGGVYSTAQT